MLGESIHDKNFSCTHLLFSSHPNNYTPSENKYSIVLCSMKYLATFAKDKNMQFF